MKLSGNYDLYAVHQIVIFMTIHQNRSVVKTRRRKVSMYNIWPGIDPVIYCVWGVHSNQLATGTVFPNEANIPKLLITYVVLLFMFCFFRLNVQRTLQRRLATGSACLKPMLQRYHAYFKMKWMPGLHDSDDI